MNGMNALTGTPLSGVDHLWQSVADILQTPIGARIIRRTYGSYVFELIDYAANELGLLLLKAAIADALAKWEPRLTLTKILFDEITSEGKITLTLEGDYIETGEAITLEGITL
ncbi:MAG: GPW/gp25 family protein [Parvibaculaceae bacterium]|nr:GPW/gp25 family protein [Parvibaculaceae bacterium]